jgi:hypothetical protein
MNSIYRAIKSEGFSVVPNVLKEDEIPLFRQLSDSYIASTFFPCNGGRVVPGWAGVTPELGVLNNLHKDPRITKIVDEALKEDWVFAEHSDLHQNKITGWHDDTLPPRLAHFQTLNVQDDGYKIIKICFLLQDHSDNDYGLWFKPFNNRSQEVCIHSNPTDAIVFDQRIVHRGQQRQQYSKRYGQHRYLITLGYGLDNEYTKQHTAGTVFRQEQQRSQMVNL